MWLSRPGFGKAGRISSFGFDPYRQVFRGRCRIICIPIAPIVRYPLEVLCELLLLLWLIAQLSLICPAWHLRLLGPDAPVRRLSVTPRNKQRCWPFGVAGECSVFYQTRLDASGGYRVPSVCSGGPIPLDIGIPACTAIGWSGIARLIPPDIDG